MKKKKLVKGKLQGLIVLFRDAIYEDVYIELDAGHLAILSDGTIFKSRKLRFRKPLEDEENV